VDVWLLDDEYGYRLLADYRKPREHR
jgi:hypothetical protein